MADMRIEKTRVATRESRDVPTRVPFGGFTYKLEVLNKDPNFYYYWFKDSGDSIERALRAGYEFVSRRDSNRVLPEALSNRDVSGGNSAVDGNTKVFGGKDEYGREYNLVLMRQPMAFHEEDMRTEGTRNDEIDQAIFRQQFQGQNVSNKYGDVKMTVKDQE